MKLSYYLLPLLIFLSSAFGQLMDEKKEFTRADTLRGMLTPYRTCYDLEYYHVDVKVDPSEKSISGKVLIKFKALAPFFKMQIDLFENMTIDKILFENKELKFNREFNAVFISMGRKIESGSKNEMEITYHGQPRGAKFPPWDGGVVWNHDSEGNPWVMVTTQGTGASTWFPCKDHQSDEPDSVLISITVPPGLIDVSNGRLRSVENLPDNRRKYNWFVSYPINNYNITFNIGKYEHFSDFYNGVEGEITLDYYVMPENLEKAKEHFQQVKSMFTCFEKYFGPYPFTRDGYKLVESSHWGMEHQTAVAYGNRYKTGQLGHAASKEGLLFDFIIIHETAHEWWGNSITSKDIADMWIHESFAVYAEALYVECIAGYKSALNYLQGIKQAVKNDKPIIGPYNVNQEGSGDMYPKGALMLNTLRHVVNDDKLWFDAIRNIMKKFSYQTITTEEIVNEFNNQLGDDYTYLFDQYLRYKDIPSLEVILEYYPDKTLCRYRWLTDVPDFNMPVLIDISPDKFMRIKPTGMWSSIEITKTDAENFKVAEDKFFVNTIVRTNYYE